MKSPGALLALILAITTSAPATADVKIVKYDNGGLISKRSIEMAEIRKNGDRVEIHSGYCNSSCTLYLGLPDVCVTQKALLGFHGPRTSFFSGRKITPQEFEKWTAWMANHYPPAIGKWFMEVARHETYGLKKLSGAELIKHGVADCDQRLAKNDMQ